MSLIPNDDKARKMLVMFRYLTRYCPKALREVTKVSVANNVRYNPDRDPADINWARHKSTDQLGSAFRHMMEREVDGKIFEDVPAEVAAVVGFDKVYVLAEAAWRIWAALELEIETQEKMQRAARAIIRESVNQACDRIAELVPSTGRFDSPGSGSTTLQYGCEQPAHPASSPDPSPEREAAPPWQSDSRNLL